MRELLADPWFYILFAGLVSLGTLWVRTFVQRSVDHRFNLRIESHKAELERLVELEKYELQRRLTATSLYLQKQHSAAEVVYSSVRVAHGAVGALFGLYEGFNLGECNEEDLRTLLGQFEVLKGKQDELLGAWRENRQEGTKAIQDYLFKLRVPLAENKLQEARNLMYINEIYFSDASMGAFDAFVRECLEWIGRAKFPPHRGGIAKKLSRDKLNAALEEVQKAIRIELSEPPRQFLLNNSKTAVSHAELAGGVAATRAAQSGTAP